MTSNKNLNKARSLSVKEVHSKIKAGLKDIKEKRMINEKDAVKEMESWLKLGNKKSKQQS
ncbi:MAG: hypothetical protein K2X48_08850 [Chitinophagaceae bacterium]|nr:hypothetical protein [Chitinophagaceae bacterium]